MDGILIIDKPEGFTSFDVVAKFRGILKTKKIGHAGTLDPMATGVLPLFIGRATKCCDILPDQNKRYLATFRLGVTTDTLDRTGKILFEQKVSATQRQVVQALECFKGEIEQLPPMYSAIQINGRRLYDLARQGIEVEREKRKITIYSLELVSANEQLSQYTIDVSCSKGTYIRTLCADIGEMLGCGAMMTDLRRTEAAGFAINDSITIIKAQELAESGTLEQRILPIERVFENLPELILEGKQEFYYKNGVKLDLARINSGRLDWNSCGDLRVMSASGGLLGISFPDLEKGELKSKKFFAQKDIIEGSL